MWYLKIWYRWQLSWSILTYIFAIYQISFWTMRDWALEGSANFVKSVTEASTDIQQVQVSNAEMSYRWPLKKNSTPLKMCLFCCSDVQVYYTRHCGGCLQEQPNTRNRLQNSVGKISLKCFSSWCLSGTPPTQPSSRDVISISVCLGWWLQIRNWTKIWGCGLRKT